MAAMKLHSLLLVLISAYTLLLSGCVTMAQVTRYQEVDIPLYTAEDYENLLDSDNPEVQYNAIANLINHAWVYANTLNKGLKPEEDSAETLAKFNSAYKVCRKIVSKTTSNNEDIQVASIIFTGKLGSSLEDKELRSELHKQIQAINTKSKRAQYEQLNALIISRLDDNQETSPDIIKKGLRSRSWIINGMTYRLLSKSQSEAYSQQLMNHYNNADENIDKLLILSALHKPYRHEVSLFLQNELINTSDKKLQEYLASLIPHSEDSAAVAQWLAKEYQNIGTDNSVIIINGFSNLLPNLGAIEFFKNILATMDSKIIQMLDNEYLFERIISASATHKDNEYLVTLDRLFLQNDQLSIPFQSYKDNVANEKYAEQAVKETLQEYIPKFIVTSEEVFTDINHKLEQHGFTNDEIDTYTKEFREEVDEIFKELAKD